MAQGTYVPNVPPTFLTDAGLPAAGYKLFTYQAGTSVKLATYSDVGLTSANANPIVLDSAGRATIFLTAASYKFVMAPPTDTDPPSSPIWTRDNIGSIPLTNVDLDIQGTAGETLTAGNVVYLSAGDGGLTAGRWYKADADFTYASTTANAIGMMPAALASGVSGSIRIVGRVSGLSALTAGTLYYVSATAGALTSTSPTNSRAVAVADSTTSVILSQWIPIGDASPTQKGLLTTGPQTLGATGVANAFTFSTPPKGLFTKAAVASDVTNVTTTFANVTGLSFPVVASGDYDFECILKVIGNLTDNSKWQFTGPASPTSVIYGVNSSITPTVGSSPAAVAFSTAVFANLSGTNDTDLFLLIKGYLVNGANAGTVQLQFAQKAASANNLTVRALSVLKVFTRA